MLVQGSLLTQFSVIRDRVRFLRQEKVRAVVAAAIEAELAALDVELTE